MSIKCLCRNPLTANQETRTLEEPEVSRNLNLNIISDFLIIEALYVI